MKITSQMIEGVDNRFKRMGTILIALDYHEGKRLDEATLLSIEHKFGITVDELEGAGIFINGEVKDALIMMKERIIQHRADRIKANMFHEY